MKGFNHSCNEKWRSSLFKKSTKVIPSFYHHIWYFYSSPICTHFSIPWLILLTVILLKIQDLFEKVVHSARDNWPVFISLWKISTEKILYPRRYPIDFNIKNLQAIGYSWTLIWPYIVITSALILQSLDFKISSFQTIQFAQIICTM